MVDQVTKKDEVKRDEPLPEKGDAAPLEGTLGPEVAGLLNLGFSAITIGMMQKLGMNTALAMKEGLMPNDPLLSQHLSGAGGLNTPGDGIQDLKVTPIMQGVEMDAPKLKSPFEGGPKFGGH